MAPIPLVLSSSPLSIRRYAPFFLPDSEYLTSSSLSRRDTSAGSQHLNGLYKRTSSPNNPADGSVDPSTIDNKGVFALFAIIGVAFVLTTLWFFFWAKNGGFVWRKGDWDDYKSTVLRRKGPNGTTLSGATKTTDLGGGSIVSSQYAETDLGYSVTSSDVTRDKEKHHKNIRGGDANNEKRVKKEKKERRRHKNKDDDDVQAYRQEKPARVGGINRIFDGEYTATEPSEWASSYGTAEDARTETQTNAETETNVESEVASMPVNRPTRVARGKSKSVSQVRPQSQPQPQSKSHSRTRKTHSSHYVRGGDAGAAQPANAKLLRRDFSFVAGSEDTISNASSTPSSQRPLRTSYHDHPHHKSTHHSAPRPKTRVRVPKKSDDAKSVRSAVSGMSGTTGTGWTEPLNFDENSDKGTKSYSHPIPGLSSGYRRAGGRRDSLSESDDGK